MTRQEYNAMRAANKVARIAAERLRAEKEAADEIAHIVMWASIQPLPAIRTKAARIAIARGLVAAVDGLLVPAGAP